MLKRILTAIVSVIILIPILWFSDTYIFPIAIAVATCISLYEMFSCIGYKNKLDVTFPSYLIGAAVPFLVKLASENLSAVLSPVFAVMILYILYLMALAVFKHKEYSIGDLSQCYMVAVYIIFGFSSIQLLREMANNVYLLIFIGAWITDIFAYFTGSFLGKHKLCEAISPKKTIEGSIGGIIFCSLSFVLFGAIMMSTNMSLIEYLILAFIGVVISIISQIGDLSMSLVKRHYGIKDFGKIFPGHGGMLDRFDSIIAVSSTLFILISALKTFNIDIFR